MIIAKFSMKTKKIYAVLHNGVKKSQNLSFLLLLLLLHSFQSSCSNFKQIKIVSNFYHKY